MISAGLKPIGPIDPNWAQCRCYLLLAVQVHKTILCRFYREQLDPHLPRPALDVMMHIPCLCTEILHAWNVKTGSPNNVFCVGNITSKELPEIWSQNNVSQ